MKLAGLHAMYWSKIQVRLSRLRRVILSLTHKANMFSIMAGQKRFNVQVGAIIPSCKYVCRSRLWWHPSFLAKLPCFHKHSLLYARRKKPHRYMLLLQLKRIKQRCAEIRGGWNAMTFNFIGIITTTKRLMSFWVRFPQASARTFARNGPL